MINDKRNLFIEYCEIVKSFGYRVFICSDPLYEYAYIVNENDELGYMQLDDFGFGVRFSTSHKPCRGYGTGFGLSNGIDGLPKITKQDVERCFIIAPEWATHSQREAVKKWTFTERMRDDEFFREKIVEIEFEIMNTKELIAYIEEAGVITSAQLYTLVRRANGGDKDVKSACFKERVVFADDILKASELKKLENEAKKRESLLGWREKNVLQGDNLRINLCCFRGSTPVYWVLSDNGSFEYYITKEINVVG